MNGNSRNNSITQADYNKLPKNSHLVVPQSSTNNNNNGSSTNSGGPFKPVPPPKPKNYRPPLQGGNNTGSQWESGVSLYTIHVSIPKNIRFFD